MLKEGVGGFGMVLAILALSALFENHIYGISSLSIGFIAGSIPLTGIQLYLQQIK